MYFGLWYTCPSLTFDNREIKTEGFSCVQCTEYHRSHCKTIWTQLPVVPFRALGTSNVTLSLFCRFSVLLKGSQKMAEFSLVVDKKEYAMTRVFSQYNRDPSNTLTVTVRLRAGQVVSVKNHRAPIIFGSTVPHGMDSFFTGFMLSPD